MNVLGKVLIGAIAAAGISTSAVAAQITGAVSFSGLGWTPTGGTGVSDATGIDFTTIDGYEFTVTAGSGIGDFSTRISNSILTPTAGNMQDFTFSPLGASIPAFWTFVDTNGETFSFELTGISVQNQDNISVELFGQGIVTHPDFDPTAGTWSWTGQEQGGSFSWSSSSAMVPAPGALVLLGIGLVGIGAVRRRLS